MFTKAFRVKSNTAIKGSDRRKLRADISGSFSSLSEEDLNQLIPNKAELNIVKIYTHKGAAVTLYVLHKNPVFFQVEKQLFPTVYTLWLYPTMLPAFATWPPVLEKLSGGADLMLPGVVVSDGFPEVDRGDCCAVTLVTNSAPMAVGTAALSSAEMRKCEMKGKGVNILHTYMDQLWEFGDKSNPPVIPIAQPSVMVEEDTGAVMEDDEKERNLCEGDTGAVMKDDEEERKIREMIRRIPEVPAELLQELLLEEEMCFGHGEVNSQSPEDFMDQLLLWCFLHALKAKVKKSHLPLLTGTFLRNFMMPCCPKGIQLEVKKSSYKKLSKFLQCMEHDLGLVRVKELSKGVDSITEVNWRNPTLVSFVAPVKCEPEEKPAEGPSESYQPPEITPLYSVTTRLQPLFHHAQKRKGATLKANQVREIITDYVKTNQLVHETNKNYIKIDPILCDCLLEKSEYQEVETLKWDDLMSRTLSRMQSCHEVTFHSGIHVIKKGEMESIDVSVASRGSNKKVTIIKNLEAFGVDPAMAANFLQHQAQASCILHEQPGSKNRVQVQVQGNQLQHVAKLLLDQFKIPRKYIQGLDKPSKPGKKK